MAVQHGGAVRDLLKLFRHFAEIVALQELVLVQLDQSEGDSEQNLRAFVEQTVPYPQDRLRERDRTKKNAQELSILNPLTK